MGWTRGTALVATLARVTQLTGQAGLTELEVGGQITLTDLLLAAANAIHDRLVGDGINPAALTNAEVFESAVAYEFLARVAMLGHLRQGEETTDAAVARFRAARDDAYPQRPRLASGPEPRHAGEAVPVTANFERGWTFGPPDGRFSTELPRGTR